MENIVKVENLSVGYDDDSSVINSLNLDIRQGEIMTIIGKSGCGKSTLLNTIAGYLQPKSGKVYLNDKVVQKPDWKIGVVFQNNSLYPWLNVYQNIAFGLKMRHIDENEIKERVDKLLSEIQLSDKGEEKIFSLSGGMKQRVAIARSLANRPELLMFDESFGALDSFTRQDIHEVILDLWKTSKITFLIITHDIDEAIKLGSRIAIMSNRTPKTKLSVVDNPYFHYNEKTLSDPKYLEFKQSIQNQI